jgi:flagellar basal-body rod protein FlgC
MNLFSSMDTAASAMSAERVHMDVISQNIANANTTNTVTGEPYRRRVAVIQGADAPQFAMPVSLDDDDDSSDSDGPAMRSGGVKVAGVAQDMGDLKRVYDPTNPNAQKQGKFKGYVLMSNVNVITEMTDMIAATRTYEANATVVESVKGMASKGLEIGRS